MDFYQELRDATVQERNRLLQTPLIGKALNGTITYKEYSCFLHEAYHHVKHTTPLLMATGARLSEEKEWLRNAIAEYIEEEVGHQEWILNDIEACGEDKGSARHSQARLATEMMVAYAYDTIHRGNPIGFFGMILVLEGTSVTTADPAADAIQTALNLPDTAFSYLRSHGALDQEHVKFFEDLMNQIDDKKEQQLIIHKARVFYHLYGEIFRSITPEK